MTMGKGKKQTACVTGASGMVGRRIVHCLLQKGYIVRAFTRRNDLMLSGVGMYCGDICDESALRTFLNGADLLFHCAAELNDESRMWSINVLATKRILKLSESAGIQYFCYLSSVGVTGNTHLSLVDELSPCNPQNTYEKSKWAAEQLVERGIQGCKTVILRPTNVINEEKPGILSFCRRNSWIDLCKVILTGGECAHIIHAEDVAEAAVYCILHSSETPQCYIVSCDHEPLNTPSGLWALYKAFCTEKPYDTVRPGFHFPLVLPYVLRRVFRGTGNKGDVRYSSKKLMETGFVFKLGLERTVTRIASASCNRIL